MVVVEVVVAVEVAATTVKCVVMLVEAVPLPAVRVSV